MSIRQEYLRAASESRKETSSLKNGFEELNNNEEFLLAITSKGFGKRSLLMNIEFQIEEEKA